MAKTVTKTVTVTTTGNNYMRRIPADQWPVIKALKEDAGWPTAAIAERYQVTPTRIRQVLAELQEPS